MKDGLQKVYYILGEGISKGMVFLVFYVFTNGLTKTDFGKLSLYWVSVPIVSLFIDLAQRSYVKRFLISKKEGVFDLIRNINLFATIVFSILFFIKYVLSHFDVYFIDDKMDFYVLVSAYLFVLIEPVLSYFQISGNPLKYSLLYIFRSSTAYIVSAAIFIFFIKDIYVFPKVYIISLSLGVFFMGKEIISRSTQFRFRAFNKSIRKSLKFSMPLIIGVLSAIGLNAADRFVINYFYSEVDVANYTVAYTAATLFMAFFMATNKWWQKFILEALRENDFKRINKKFPIYFGIVISVALLVYLLRRPIILILSNSQYLETIELIPILLLGMLFYFLYSVLVNVPFYYERTNLQVLPALFAFIINIILNIVLIPKFGYKIAAWTTCISYFIEFLLMYIVCVKIFKIDFMFRNPLRLKNEKGEK